MGQLALGTRPAIHAIMVARLGIVVIILLLGQGPAHAQRGQAPRHAASGLRTTGLATGKLHPKRSSAMLRRRQVARSWLAPDGSLARPQAARLLAMRDEFSQGSLALKQHARRSAFPVSAARLEQGYPRAVPARLAKVRAAMIELEALDRIVDLAIAELDDAIVKTAAGDRVIAFSQALTDVTSSFETSRRAGQARLRAMGADLSPAIEGYVTAFRTRLVALARAQATIAPLLPRIDALRSEIWADEALLKHGL